MINFTQQLKTINNQHLYRQRQTVSDGQHSVIHINGRRLVNFCSNDYLSLANHPQVKAALKQGVDQYGVGSGASHLVSGHSKAHHQLEEALAEYTNQQRALLFSTGYSANLGVFSALRDELDWVLQDKLNHASLIDANQLTGLALQRYRHNDLPALAKKLQKQSGSGLVVTDHVFSMDGDRADMSAINQLTQAADALLMQDDAHGFGLFIPNIPKGSIYMATLGKAAGVSGAFVAGDEDLIEFLIQKSRPYIYTTATPPALCVATLKSLELIQQGEQTDKLLNNITLFKQLSQQLSLPIEVSDSAIQPLIVGESEKALSLSQQLFDQGFYVSAIRPPTVPPKTARLRITLSADHTEAQIQALLERIAHAL